ncbi:MAG: hypothetical protein MPK06_01100 [Alphaproteobacteria bacterium]|nr:hypothetical protein [Alphaproteobacteria bacterium]MDA8003481.1 hypothetical protein [Alphaproteobacteria bacterium]MDA8005131.1 hypothetical protein [Alphaproteobacteria bacterium]
MSGLSNDGAKKLCLDLLHADSQGEVIELLSEAGYWRDERHWHPLGDNSDNFGTTGGVQRHPDQALVEKLVNSIDAKIINEARLAGDLPLDGSEKLSADAPKNIQEAKDKYFSRQLCNPAELSRGITVATTVKDAGTRPCFTVADDGEGQTPCMVPETLLSISKGNKKRMRFVQGKHNTGGAGVLAFCGEPHQFQLIISKRNPKLLSKNSSRPHESDWSFTIVRISEAKEDVNKSSFFVYLSPVESDRQKAGGRLLHFSSDTLEIFPEQNRAYARAAAWGTVVKVYEYNNKRFKTNMMMRGGFMYRARILLPEPILPIRFHECRGGFKGDPKRSFATTMLGLMETLQNNYDGKTEKRTVEWRGMRTFKVEEEEFSIKAFLFNGPKEAATYRGDEGVILTYNGQSHHIFTKNFFQRKALSKLDYISDSLLIFVDCSKISIRTHEKLFMSSRDRSIGSDKFDAVEEEVQSILKEWDELRELNLARRTKAMQSKTSESSEATVKIISDLLAKSPSLAQALGLGARIKTTHPPRVKPNPSPYEGRRFPEIFHFLDRNSGESLDEKAAHIGSRVKIEFKTDAVKDYFNREEDPGDFRLYQIIEGERVPVSRYQTPNLHDGDGNKNYRKATLWFNLPDDAKKGDVLEFLSVVTDIRTEIFENSFTLKVEERRPPAPPQPPKPDHRNLDIPSPKLIYSDRWDEMSPPFDKFTAMRVKSNPQSEGGRETYDYFLNMDNVHLQTFLKENRKSSGSAKKRFEVGMTLIALAVIAQKHVQAKSGSRSSENEDMPVDDGDADGHPSDSVHRRVAHTTSAIAPFLLPMLEHVGQIEAEEDKSSLSDSAGEDD